MGCFNETCLISQLPITHGDSVRLFLIVKNNLIENNNLSIRFNRCSSDGLWQPYSLPIKGVYNDYGWIENMKSEQYVPVLMDLLQKDLVYKETGDKLILEGFDDLISLLRNEEVYLKFLFGTRWFGYVMVLEDIYQTVLNLEMNDSLRLPTKIEIKKMIDDTIIELYRINNFKSGQLCQRSRLRMISKFYNMGLSLNLTKSMALIEEMTKDGMKPNNPKITNLADIMAEIVYFNYNMNQMDKIWVPQNSGRQITEYKANKVLAEKNYKIM